MKKQTINFSWPATLSDFSTDSAQENFTRGKLKVFYKGETADHRYFSDEFSENLLKSLPYTPVVSHYDAEKDDFVGHSTEQDIYGIVDPCIAPSFEEDEDGKSWCVCDVVLYTDRPDKVGEIAKKIIGHKQSLELDPKTVKYTVNYDEKRHFKNIEFTAGTFVGVSVLGEDQQPAFTGSEFFNYNEDFSKKMEILRNYCERKNDQVDNGGSQMNLQEFMKLSWGDISSKVDEALMQEYGAEAYTMIVDMFENCAIVRFYSYIDGSNKLMRVNYSCDESGVITLGNVNEVHVVYEDVVTSVSTATVTEETGVETTSPENATIEIVDSTAEIIEETVEVSSDSPEVVDSSAEIVNAEKEEEEEKDEEEEKEEDKKEEEDKPCCEEEDKKKKCGCETDETSEMVAAACDSDAANAAQVSNAEVTEVTENVTKVSVENEEPKQEENSSSTSFTESERAEFETLKREEKISLIDSYKDNLSEEEYNKFMSSVDIKSKDELEVELLKAYKQYAEEQLKQPKAERAFSFAPILNIKEKKQDSLDTWVRNNL